MQAILLMYSPERWGDLRQPLRFALETQYFPDTIHHENFPSYVFGGENGREYDSVTVYKFEA